ncbi:MAG: hypothetical protein ACOYOK_04400 [Pseudobdellovibrionaceae bacterium]
MKIIIAISTMLICATFSVISHGKSCVLFFEQQNHPFNKILSENIKILNDKGYEIDLFLQAKPKDFINCIKKDYQKVFYIGHTLLLQKKSSRINFVYYSELADQEHEDFRSNAINTIQAELTIKEKKWRYTYSNPRDNEKETLAKDIRDLKSMLYFYQYKVPQNNIPLYAGPKIMLSSLFESAAEILQSKNIAPELYFMTCNFNTVVQRYSIFKTIINNSSVFESAPESGFASWLHGQPLTKLDWEWLEQRF